jgi:hypothetical protein
MLSITSRKKEKNRMKRYFKVVILRDKWAAINFWTQKTKSIGNPNIIIGSNK